MVTVFRVSNLTQRVSCYLEMNILHVEILVNYIIERL